MSLKGLKMNTEKTKVLVVGESDRVEQTYQKAVFLGTFKVF